MSIINATPLLAAAGGDYQISRSVRLRSSASAYFNRTPASTTNTTTWTWSAWIKRGQSAQGKLFGAATGTSNTWYFQFSDNVTDALTFGYFNGTNAVQVTTTPVYRDYSAWYHVVLAVDTTQATASNRVKIYVNGVQVTSFATATYPTLNQTTWINNNTAPQYIGATSTNTSSLWEGYLTEVNFIDGQALTPSSFGETDSITGVWKPKKYAGTYGTNGFYLNFSDNSSNTATTIGKDYSGNGNNWTPNNISVTAGSTYDSMIDTPTPYSDLSYGRGNYAVLNPLFRNASMISDGNLYFNKSTIGWATGQATMPLPASKTYFEATATAVGGANSGVFIGIATASATQDAYQIANQWSFGGTGGTLKLYNQTTLVTPSGSSGAGDIFQVAYDGATGNLWFGKNNSWYDSSGGTTGNPSTGANPTMTLTAGTEVFPCAICYANGLKFTFGQQPFAYTPPTGFKALNTQNLPEPTIKKGNQFFDATTYTGNGTSLTVANAAGFQPDLVWLKARSIVEAHELHDAVRGASNLLKSNSTAAEVNATNTLTSFNSNGFSLGSSTEINTNAATFVAWQWKESPSAGFDIVTYTGTGVARTISHSLGVAPKMIIVKARNSTGDWQVYTNTTGAGNFLLLNSTAASSASSTKWNNTAPTSSVFSVGVDTTTNMATTTYVAYLFSEVASFSRMGSYQGNGSSDGPFVFCGFRPKFILYKLATGAAADWCIADTSRDGINVTTNRLRPNWSDAEFTNSTHSIDFLSNGFKVRGTDNAVNLSGNTIIFAAFAENPFKNSLAR